MLHDPQYQEIAENAIKALERTGANSIEIHIGQPEPELLRRACVTVNLECETAFLGYWKFTKKTQEGENND